MKLEDQVCSIELAKRLKELGIKQESLYGWSLQSGKLKHNESVLTCAQAIKHPLYNKHLQKETYVSAFTVAELGEMLPKGIVNPQKLWTQIYLKIEPSNRLGYWVVSYGNNILTEENTEANARANMLIYLLENGFMKNEPK